MSRFKRDQQSYPRFGGEQGREGGKGLTLLLREDDQALNTPKHIINTFKFSCTYYFLQHLIPEGLCCFSPNTRDTSCMICGLPQTILTLARINIHIFLSIFYAHHFFTWFSVWKFKNPLKSYHSQVETKIHQN